MSDKKLVSLSKIAVLQEKPFNWDITSITGIEHCHYIC